MFLESLRLQQYSALTVGWYARILFPFGRYLKEEAGTDDPSAVSEGCVRAFLLKAGEEGLDGRAPVGARRLNHYRQCLSLFYRWMQGEGYVNHNPAERIRKVREPKPLIPALSEAQVCALVEAPDRSRFVGLRDRSFLLLLLDTGVRLSEALGLRVGDLNLEEKSVTVMGKGSKERRLALSSHLLSELTPYLRKRDAAMAAIGLPDAPWLFPNDVGGRLGSKTVQQHLRRYGQEAGIKGVRVSPHTLRHTYALSFVRNGGDPFTLQKVLGHNSLETSRRYCDLTAADVLARQRELTPLATMNLNLRPARRIPRGGVQSW
jgi:integrase/recombinase XerD